MPPTSWISKLKRAMARTTASPFFRKKNSPLKLGVLAFEVSATMSKLFSLWQSLSDDNIRHLRTTAIDVLGVRKIVSNDESFLLGLACAEMVETLRVASLSISRFAQRCADVEFRCFDRRFSEFAESGRDPNRWVFTLTEMEAKVRGLDKHVTLTNALSKAMDELRKTLNGRDQVRAAELQSKVRALEKNSLWNCTYDSAVSLMARAAFTVLARIKHVFGIGSSHVSLPRSLSASAAVFPTDHNAGSLFTSGPLRFKRGFMEANAALLRAPETTLGARGLAVHYANVIILVEKMLREPQRVGEDARGDLYAMLPESVRWMVRARLRGVGATCRDAGLAREWREAVGRILGWLAPLASNMMKWQSERSFERQSNVAVSNVLLLQTLVYANKEKTEAAITELLVGLNYIWRFEREMSSKVLLRSATVRQLFQTMAR